MLPKETEEGSHFNLLITANNKYIYNTEVNILIVMSSIRYKH